MEYRAVLLLLLLNWSCQSPGEEQKTDGRASTNRTMAGMSQAKFDLLIENCDYIDFILYNYDFSISQNQKSQIIGTLQQIGPPLSEIPSNCNSIGRIFFQSKGENIAEADIYFSEGCTYYYFLEDNKPTYAHQLSNNGILFYNQIFQQFNQQRKGGN